MGNAVAEVMVHFVVRHYDQLFGTAYDVDGERGMGEEEEYYLTEAEQDLVRCWPTPDSHPCENA